MADEAARFGITHDDEQRPVPWVSKAFPEWRDGEIEAGLDQVAARIRRHPEFRPELERLERDLIEEQGRRQRVYADVAAALLGSAADQGEG